MLPGNGTPSALGNVFVSGDAPSLGSTDAIGISTPMVALVALRRGPGYWLVASDRGIFSFGDGPSWGRTGGIRLDEPIVGMSRT